MTAAIAACMSGEPARPSSPFPLTRLSLLEGVQSADAPVRRQAFDVLVTAYWKPIYTYVRLRWRLGRDDAEDVTQGFLAAAFERRFFDTFDPSKARFRTFLRICLDRFVQNQQQASARQKRGGGVPLAPLDFETAEGELRVREPAAPGDFEHLFRQEVIRSLFARAVDAVRDTCERAGRDVAFHLFARYDLEPERRRTYAALAAESGLTIVQVTNQLALARRMFRAAVLNELREMTGSDREFRLEARDLLGIDVS